MKVEIRSRFGGVMWNGKKTEGLHIEEEEDLTVVVVVREHLNGEGEGEGEAMVWPELHASTFFC